MLIAVPSVIIAVLFIIALPDSPEKYVLDLEGDALAFEDPKLVTNSDIGFFYKNEQLSQFRNQSKPEMAKIIKMSDSIVSTDFTKQPLSVVPDTESSYTGTDNVIVHEGSVKEYVVKSDAGYELEDGQVLPEDSASKISVNTGLIKSSPTLTQKVEPSQVRYAAFTDKLQSIYFEFEAGNEFASVLVSGLTGRVEYTLLDSEMVPLKNGWNGGSDTLEVKYKARYAAKYYLKLTGSFDGTLKPFAVSLPSDDNEWMQQMQSPEVAAEVTGRFDYYGDEDFFVIPEKIRENIDCSVISFSELDSTANVVVYDEQKNAIAQYIYEPEATEKVSMYALENAYAVSVYCVNGSASGTEYTLSLDYADSEVLDIQTYGFALSPAYSDTEDYYTAEIATLTGKKITEIMTAVDYDEISISVKQQCGYTYNTKVGETLDLAPGRNTVTVSFEKDGERRDVTIVISHRAGQVYYGFTTDGKKVYVVDDKSKDNYTIIQKANGDYEQIRNDRLFRYYETTMPESYRDGIEALREKYPEWKFTFVKTGWDFNSYIDSQMGYEGSVPVSQVNNKKATREQVIAHVDPRNFLNERDIFMFENQLYVDGVYSNTGVIKIWNKGSSYAKDEPYASFIMEAGRSSGLSTYFVAARAALESGRGTSNLSKGLITEYRGYYNFYGIGANDANPANGAVKAYELGWNTKRKSIIEGAAWIKDSYVGAMQNTAYFMKFCFITGREWHQYMTDIEAPEKDASSSYEAHAAGGTLSSPIEFIIPVFENMP